MNGNPEFASFARLIESLRPWLDQVVIVGGWAHRLYRLHAFAQPLRYEPLATLDADIALPTRFKVTGDEIYQRLASNGFEAEFLGHHKPPAAHYRLIDPGIEFYAEFVAPLAGSTVTRRGRSKATQSVGGISSQNLRYVEVLLARPWSVTLSASNGFPLADDTPVQIANPVTFLVRSIACGGLRLLWPKRAVRFVIDSTKSKVILRAPESTLRTGLLPDVCVNLALISQQWQ